jgi:hypothetical protein
VIGAYRIGSIVASTKEALDGVRRKPARTRGAGQKKRAGDGIRTHGPLLGKHVSGLSKLRKGG